METTISTHLASQHSITRTFIASEQISRLGETKSHYRECSTTRAKSYNCRHASTCHWRRICTAWCVISTVCMQPTSHWKCSYGPTVAVRIVAVRSAVAGGKAEPVQRIRMAELAAALYSPRCIRLGSLRLALWMAAVSKPVGAASNCRFRPSQRSDRSAACLNSDLPRAKRCWLAAEVHLHSQTSQHLHQRCFHRLA